MSKRGDPMVLVLRMLLHVHIIHSTKKKAKTQMQLIRMDHKGYHCHI